MMSRKCFVHVVVKHSNFFTKELQSRVTDIVFRHETSAVVSLTS
jgi:predicted TIM-barrel enzyme